MAFEFKLFGMPISLGKFDYFDLMDSTVPAERKRADVVTLDISRPTAANFNGHDDSLKTAA